MKRIFVVFCLSIFLSSAFAGGGMTHMFIAEQAISRLPITPLRNLLLDNLDAYLVGAYYPDSGYDLSGNKYGEISHHDPFIYALLDLIKEKYKFPTIENPKLVAFLFGIATHRVADEIMHFTFYKEMKDKDFKGNVKETHQYGDVGIDLLLNIDKNRWASGPKKWWVPVGDLLIVYERMGVTNVNAMDIIVSNSIISLASYGEKLISIPAYPILRLRMPWTASHYYDWPMGGLNMNIEKVVEYHTQLWDRLQSPSAPSMTTVSTFTNFSLNAENNDTSDNPAIAFAKTAIKEGVLTMASVSNADGSVEIEQPQILNAKKLGSLLTQLTKKVLS